MDVRAEHQIRMELFGVPVAVESNSAYAVEVAEETGRQMGAVAASDAAPLVRLRVLVEPTRHVHDVTDAVEWRVPDPDHALMRAHGMTGWLDLAAADGVVYVDEAYSNERALFSRTVFKAPFLTLITRRDRHPVHAAALRVGDAALLLQGPSGVGKSTLCYVASRAGIDVLSDDSVRVQLDPELRIWGLPGRVHLLEDAAARFDALRANGSTPVNANGRVKHLITIGSPVIPMVRRARVCLLRRGPAVSFAPVSPEEIRETLLSAPEARFDMYPAGRERAMTALAALGGWSLTLTDDAEEAVPALLELMARLGQI